MESAYALIAACVGVGYFVGRMVGRNQEREKCNGYVHKLFVEFTIAELLDTRKKARQSMNLRGN